MTKNRKGSTRSKKNIWKVLAPIIAGAAFLFQHGYSHLSGESSAYAHDEELARNFHQEVDHLSDRSAKDQVFVRALGEVTVYMVRRRDEDLPVMKDPGWLTPSSIVALRFKAQRNLAQSKEDWAVLSAFNETQHTGSSKPVLERLAKEEEFWQNLARYYSPTNVGSGGVENKLRTRLRDLALEMDAEDSKTEEAFDIAVVDSRVHVEYLKRKMDQMYGSALEIARRYYFAYVEVIGSALLFGFAAWTSYGGWLRRTSA